MIATLRRFIVFLLPAAFGSGAVITFAAERQMPSADDPPPAVQGEWAPKQIEDLPGLKPRLPILYEPPARFSASPVDLNRLLSVAPTTQFRMPVMEGYRVQVFSGTERRIAQALEARLREKYSLPVYMLFEAPQYKVRVGDYPTRAEADHWCQQLRDDGFPDAWVVKSPVNPPR